ncbi:MAG: hypothetical protein KAQ98_09885 [Bacteriovoracaceae bacterium]|nr:hypothetical protein [Bacteriovoracaceae bacterium]
MKTIIIGALIALLSISAYSKENGKSILLHKNKKPYIINTQKIVSFSGDKGNGGDWFCENRIKTVRDNIKSWIFEGRSNNLELPDNITANEYNLRMLKAMELVRNIDCTDEKLFVGGVEKTCKNFKDEETDEWWIRCNYNRFLVIEEGQQLGDRELNRAEHYPFVHHEFAGVAGLEKNEGVESDYRISNQITMYLRDQIVSKLPIVSLEEIAISDDEYPVIALNVKLMHQALGYASIKIARLNLSPIELMKKILKMSPNVFMYYWKQQNSFRFIGNAIQDLVLFYDDSPADYFYAIGIAETSKEANDIFNNSSTSLRKQAV